MAKRVFFSFHYRPDNWRVSQVRNIGAIEGNIAAKDNDWETVTKSGDAAIEKWINEQLSGRVCTIVLIGANTAGRKWINHEIIKSWNDNKGVLGIYIDNLRDSDGKQCAKGANPFDNITLGKGLLSSVVKAYNPPYSDSKEVYAYIEKNMATWIDEAIAIRARN